MVMHLTTKKHPESHALSPYRPMAMGSMACVRVPAQPFPRWSILWYIQSKIICLNRRCSSLLPTCSCVSSTK